MAPRSVRSAVQAAVRHARSAGRIQPWHEPDVLLASRLAERLDDKDTPRTELAKLSAELRASLRDLPLPDPTEPAGDGDDTEPDDGYERLARSGPTMGDS